MLRPRREAGQIAELLSGSALLLSSKSDLCVTELEQMCYVRGLCEPP